MRADRIEAPIAIGTGDKPNRRTAAVSRKSVAEAISPVAIQDPDLCRVAEARPLMDARLRTHIQ